MPSSPDENERIARIAMAQQALAKIAADEEAHAKAEASRQKWEYLRMYIYYSGGAISKVTINGSRELNLKKWDALHIYIDGLGLEGWEMVSQSLSGYEEVLYFKRPKT